MADEKQKDGGAGLVPPPPTIEELRTAVLLLTHAVNEIRTVLVHVVRDEQYFAFSDQNKLRNASESLTKVIDTLLKDEPDGE